MGHKSVFYRFCQGHVKRQNIDFKRHIKDIMNSEGKNNNYPINSKNLLNMTIFKDTSFRFLYQKTERISTAIYLITNLMSTEEPMKWRLRKTALDLLNIVMSLSNTNLSSRDKNLREVNKELFYLISLYEVAFRSGFISQMNYEIVNNEMQKLANFLVEYDREDSSSRNNLFIKDFFEEGVDDINKGQIQKDIYKKDNMSYKGHYKRQDKEMSFIKTKANNNINKSSDRSKRREKIISIVKGKGEVSVKDISDVIKDTSEKTIQRELISMVEEGLLIKEGERRWSRYSIKK